LNGLDTNNILKIFNFKSYENFNNKIKNFKNLIINMYKKNFLINKEN